MKKTKAFIRLLLFLFTITAIIILFPKEYKFKYEFQTQKPWMYNDLLAPFSFAVKKSGQQIEQEKEEIIQNIRPYFRYSENTKNITKEKISTEFDDKWGKKHGNTINNSFKKLTLDVCLKIADTVYSTGIIEFNEIIEDRSNDFSIYLLTDNYAEEKELGDFFTIKSAVDFFKKETAGYSYIDSEIAFDILNNSISQNVIYDADLTYQEISSKINNISYSKGKIQKGERIISRGELVDEDRFLILNSLKSEYEGQAKGLNSVIIILIGQFILITIAITVLILFLLMFRKDVLNDNKKLTLILSLILLMVLSVSMLLRNFHPDVISIVPLCLVPFIVRVFFDTRLALFVHIITIIILGFLVPNGFQFIFLQLIAGIVTIISIVRIEKRYTFFFTSIMIFITYSIIYTGICLMQDGNLSGIDENSFIFFAANSALTLLSFPIIALYEKIFGYITNLSLMELSNINNKLLRELSIKAPGTFQHSLQVANLAEEAVYRIGGNALLARTGALYHDIGKLENSKYFTENQIGGINPHEKLSLTESAIIITSHVSKGLEIAHKFKLPDQITDFIKTHHGTRKTGYFYTLFKKSHSDIDEITDAIFTYTGPIPFSKETAVVMMADAIEAASKSLRMPDKQHITDLVEDIIDKQIEQRQFKNSDITLKEIAKIKTIFKQRLMNIYHIRIEYPKEDDNGR